MKRGRSLVYDTWRERFPDSPKEKGDYIYFNEGDTFDIIADYAIEDGDKNYYTILLDEQKKYTIIRKTDCEIIQDKPSNILTTCL
jgi:hypothetical protein